MAQPSTTRRGFTLAGLALSTLAWAGAAHAQGVIKIGEINSYKAQPAFLEPYKKGMELAVEQINAQGGLLGKLRPLFKLGLGGPIGDGKQYFSWISLIDEIRAIEFLLSSTISGPVTAPRSDDML